MLVKPAACFAGQTSPQCGSRPTGPGLWPGHVLADQPRVSALVRPLPASWGKPESQEGASWPPPHTWDQAVTPMGRCPQSLQVWRTKPELLPEKAGREGRGCQEEELMTMCLGWR